MAEEVHVLVVLAFGLGINKPNVRAVIRLGLPDSIEQFYQETAAPVATACLLIASSPGRKRQCPARLLHQSDWPLAGKRSRWQRYYRMQ